MLITKSNASRARLAKIAPSISTTLAETNPNEASAAEPPSSEPGRKDSFKKTVTGAAYAAGGAFGGLVLGAVTGEVMSHLTKNDLFVTLGGGVGALGGAATSLALSLSDEPVSVGRTFGAWAGTAAGASVGMYALGGLGSTLASHGASALFGSHGALIGALGTGIAGAGVAFSGDSGKVGTIVKSAAKGSAGVLGGLLAGGAVQAFLSQASYLAPLAATAPIVGAATLGLVGIQNEVNKGWIEGYNYKPSSEGLDTLTKTTLSGAAGYGAGFVVGAVGHAMTGVPAYSAVAPALGAAVGALGSYGGLKKNQGLIDIAVTGAAAGAGGVVGDAVGRGLTALTGQAGFTYLGAAAGALTGGSLALATQDRLNGYVAPSIAGTAGGTVGGALIGYALSALTGHSGYQLAGTAIGATAGLFLGLAGGAHAMDRKPLPERPRTKYDAGIATN